jgi:hypothetical protein
LLAAVAMEHHSPKTCPNFRAKPTAAADRSIRSPLLDFGRNFDSEEGDLSDSTYTYGIHTNLTAPQLFFLVMLDESAQQLGVEDVTALACIIAGWNFLPTRRKPLGATVGTSIASRVARKHLDFKISKEILPTLTFGSVKRFKILWTRNIGVFVGRAVPIVGEIILAYDVSIISYRSVVRYNQLVKLEDRL